MKIIRKCIIWLVTLCPMLFLSGDSDSSKNISSVAETSSVSETVLNSNNQASLFIIK